MKIVQHGRKRKAISPVLATVILIAITLIAAIAVAGFVFGLFGSFTKTAQISATVVTCSIATKTCSVSLVNTGAGNANTVACSVTVAGVTAAGTNGGAAATNVVAGAGATTATCTALAAVGTLGAQVVGSFTLSNGGTVQFTGTWSA
jgi:flagellin-like protein